MGLINNENQFDVFIQIEKSLDEEWVRNFVFLPFVIFEPGAIVEGHFINDDFGGNGRFGVFLVSDFNFGLADVIKGGLEAIVLDNKFGAIEVWHDGTFPDTSVTNHDNGILILVVDRDGFDTGVNEKFEFVEIDGIGVFVHLIFK